MTINFIMNSISDAHSNKRIKDFEEQGFNARIFGFERNVSSQYRSNISILGNFANSSQYYKRIKIYINGIRKAFKTASKNEDLWFYQGLDTALFAVIFGKKRKYIYEECDMVHTNIKNCIIRYIFEKLDKYIIKNSYKTIVTSEGFLMYHYKDTKTPKNVVLLPNKLSPKVRACKFARENDFNPSHIKFAFVGALKHPSINNIARVISCNFPNHEFHFYGYIAQTINKKELPQGENIYYHGEFHSPEDLPKIYSEIDIVIATYDITGINARFAEPNKFYESIYFRIPLVVSKETFLEKKVRNFKIGYSVNAYDEEDVKKLVKNVERTYLKTKEAISKIPQDYAIDNYNVNDLFNDK